MRIFSEHHLRDSEAFLRSANAALIKGLPKFRVHQRLTVAGRSRAYFLWEAPSEHELRELIEREFLLAESDFFGLWIIPAIEFPPAITSVFPRGLELQRADERLGCADSGRSCDSARRRMVRL
jgi:hypothetical protein